MPHHPTLRSAAARSVEELRMLVEAGATPQYLHFWGHRPEEDGTVGRGSLSQWFETPFDVDGVRYRTAEHWMMAQKARLFGDPEAERAAVDAPSPALAKEASPRDRVWGIGMGARNENAERPAAWRGLNLLGFALMEARERLRS